jgi:hypothetical protein
LADAGVTDGQVLYLRDVARDPGAAPVVEDIDELVAEETERLRERSHPKGLAVVSFGLVWLTLSAVLAAVRHGDSLLTPAVFLIVGGLVALSMGWALHQLRTPVQPALCIAVSLTAVPCLAVAGGLLGQALAGAQFFWLGAIIGANAATLMALATVPEPGIVALEVPLGAAAVVAALLLVLRADLTSAAVTAAIAVCALALIGFAKPLAASIAAWSGKIPRNGPAVAEATTALLTRARQTLAVILAVPALALAVAMPMLAMARDRQPFAIVLAGAAGIALLVRTRRAGFTVEVVLVGAAGSIGVFAVLAVLAERYLGGGSAVFALTAAALGVVGSGIALSVLGHPEATSRDSEPTLGGPAEGPDRYRWVDVIGMLCNIASATLAMAVFGVFDELVDMGRRIIG